MKPGRDEHPGAPFLALQHSSPHLRNTAMVNGTCLPSSSVPAASMPNSYQRKQAATRLPLVAETLSCRPLQYLEAVCFCLGFPQGLQLFLANRPCVPHLGWHSPRVQELNPQEH